MAEIFHFLVDCSLIGPVVGGLLFTNLGYNAIFVLALSIISLDVVLRLTLVERPEMPKRMQAQAAGHGDSGPMSQLAEAQTPIGPATAARAKTHLINDKPADEHTGLDDITDAPRNAQLDTQAPLLLPPPTSTAHPGLASETSSPTPPPTIPPKPSSGQLRRSRQLPTLFAWLSSRRLLTALCGTVTVTAVASGLAATLPLHTAAVFGWRAAASGLVFVPLAATTLLGPAVGRACARFGPRWLVAGGLALLSCVAHDSRPQRLLLFALLVLVGCGCDLAMGPLMGESAHAAERRQQKKQQPQ